MSASDSCVDFAILRRSLPTRRVRMANNGMRRERKERELPAEQQHADHRRDDRRHALRDARRRVRDDVLDAADVVVDPRLHLAGSRPGEERKRQSLQVAEDGRAQVVHDTLADLVESSVWTTPSTPVTTAIAIIPPAFQEIAALSCCTIAFSTRRRRNAGTTPSAAVTTISASRPGQAPRYG